VIAISDSAATLDKALVNAVKKSVGHIAGADDLKARLAEAQARMGG
jgi:hypothetical protein